MLRRSWGSIFYAFLPAPAPLGQHLLCIFTCSPAPAPLEQNWARNLLPEGVVSNLKQNK
jgi:hypothetical protein